MKKIPHAIKVGLIVGSVMLLIGLVAEWNIRSWIDHGPNIGGPLFTLIVGGFTALPLGIFRNLSGIRAHELVGAGYLSWISWVNAAIAWFVIGTTLGFVYGKVKSLFFKPKN